MYMHPSPSTTPFVRPLLLVIATTKIFKKSEFEEIDDEGMTQEKQEVQKNAVARDCKKIWIQVTCSLLCLLFLLCHATFAGFVAECSL